MIAGATAFIFKSFKNMFVLCAFVDELYRSSEARRLAF